MNDILLCMLIIKKDILVFVEGPTDELDDTAIIAEAKYSIHITKSKKNYLRHSNGVKIHLSRIYLQLPHVT